MLARKHLVGRPFRDATAGPEHPVVDLRFGPRPGEHSGDTVVVSIELTGHASTLLLLSEGGSRRTILGALRPLPGARRDLSSGAAYEPPALPGRLLLDRATPAALRDTVHRLAASTRSSRGGARLLSRCFEGVGRRLADAALARVAIAPEGIGPALSESQAAALLEALRNFIETPCEPRVAVDTQGVPVEILPFPLPDQTTLPAPSLSEALDGLCGAQDEADRIDTARSRLLRTISRHVKHREEKIARQRESLEAARGGDHHRRYGDLLLAQGEVQRKGLPALEVNDVFEPEAPRVRIPLDPRKTLLRNAEDLYRRAAKARRALRHLGGVLAQGESELRFLAEQRLHAEQAQDAETLESIEETIRDSLLSRAGKPREVRRVGRREGTADETGPRRFEIEGWEILAGRHSRDNDQIVRRLGQRDDFWLHARGVPGAHVMVRSRGAGEPPARILEAAAGIAAHFSRACHESSADVTVARLRDVRKPPGLLPGQVQVTRSRTLRVRPGLPEPAGRRAPG
jgi:predicted ribosome quality control (RQC) complex YloA/Tae2 family protein